MAITIKRDGIVAYLEWRYGEGAYKRFTDRLSWGWTKAAIAEEFGNSERNTVQRWISAMKEEMLWLPEYEGPGASKGSSN